MRRKLQEFWHKLSELGVPEGLSPDERKLHVSANQMIMVAIALMGNMAFALTIAWIYLLQLDFEFYKGYYVGGAAPLGGLMLSFATLYYKSKTKSSLAPNTFFAYTMFALTIATTVVFGGYYGLEFWTIAILGSVIFVLNKRPVQRRIAIATGFLIFFGLRIWIINFPELLPVPHRTTRTSFYVLMSVAIFVVFYLEFRFIAQQSSKAEDAFIAQRDLADKLLLNVMPASVAAELKAKGKYEPRHYDAVTVLFTDFVGFTKLAATMKPADLVQTLDDVFRQFDQIVMKHGLEKLKTIGDAYMCASGIPNASVDHAERAARVALEFRDLIAERKKSAEALGEPFWDIRIGLNTGPVVAGIIGDHKFAYDIWGDTVNIASRMESSGEVGKINISASTADLIRNQFTLKARGLQAAKGLGEVEMFELVG